MAKKILVYWRDIPSQVIVQQGRRREKMPLAARFQEAIDRAAMRAGKGGSDAYLAEWRRVTEQIPQPADLVDYVRSEVVRLEQDFSDERLTTLIRSHGKIPDQDEG